MKYIDSEKLLAEIERRRLSNRYIDTDGYENELLEIITSLQQEMELPEKYQTPDWLFEEQEQPEVDLEKEISDTCRSYRIRGDFDGAELNKHDIENIASHFYELGLNTKKEE
jgi:hypothetical protein